MWKYNLLILLGWTALFIGIVLQAKSGTIQGDALIPIPLIYGAIWLKANKKSAPDCSRKAEQIKTH